jgi:tetratricopeptide (TPR) repeat protein
LNQERTAMRPAIYLAFVISLPAQRPEVNIPAAGETHDAGELPAIERKLIQLLADPTAHLDTYQTAMANSNLGVIYQDLGDAVRAERAYLKARDILEPGIDNAGHRVLWARTLINLASMYIETGQYGKAERLVKVLRKTDGLEPDDVARFRGTVASLHRVRGRLRESEDEYLSLLTYWEQKGSYRDAAVVMNNLGVLSFDRNDPRTAAKRFRQAVDLWRRTGTAEHPASMIAVANCGTALLATGEPREAVEMLGKAAALARRWHGEAAPVTTHITSMYARALDANGEKKQARRIRTELKNVKSLVPVNPGRHSVDILDLARGR